MREPEVPFAPLDELWIVVAAVTPSAGQVVHMSYDTTAATPEVQDVHRAVDLDTATLEHVENPQRGASPIRQKFLDVCRSLNQEHQPRRWKRQTVRCPCQAADGVAHDRPPPKVHF